MSLTTRIVSSLVVLAVLQPAGLAAPPEPGFVELQAEHPLPIEARWLGAADDKSVALSDLSASVLSLRLNSGVVGWQRTIKELSRVWAPDDAHLVAVGAEVVVLKREIGTRVWRRSLGCEADGCRERVVHVDASGVYVARGKPVSTVLARLDLATGKPLWRRFANVDHPRAVVATGRALALQESNPPYQLRFISKGAGTSLGTWTHRDRGSARPTTDLVAGPAGTVVAVDRRPDDGSLIHFWVLNDAGDEERHGVVARPGQVANQVLWVKVVDGILWGFVPDPKRDQGHLVGQHVDGSGRPRLVAVSTWRAPTVAEGAAVWAEARAGSSVTVKAIGLGAPRRAGFDAQLEVGRAAEVRLLSDAHFVAVAGAGDPGHLWVVVPRDSRVAGYGMMPFDASKASRLVRTPSGFLVAGGRSIAQLTLRPLVDKVADYQARVDAGDIAGADAILEQLRPLASRSDAVSELVRQRGRRSRTRAPRR